MKQKLMKLLGASAISLVMGATTALADGDLFIYNWTDYTAPDLIKKFEMETGINVTIDTYDSNESLLAKLKSGAKGYDIIVPSHSFVKIFIQEGLLEKINASELNGYENIKKEFRDTTWDSGNVYTIPWQWGTTSFIVNTDVYKGDIDTYDVLFNPPAELQGKIGMFKSAEEVIGMALLSLKFPLCTEDPNQLTKVLELLKKQKPHVKIYSSDGILERMVSGDAAMHQNWNGYSIRIRDEIPSVKYAFPKEGIVAWADNIAVAKGSPNKANAIKFIEFIMQPENIAIQSNFASYSNGIAGSEAFMTEKLKSSPELLPPSGSKLVFSQTCSPKAVELQNRVWTSLLK